MEDMAKIINELNNIKWRTAITITPDAETLIQEHIMKMRIVIDYLGESKGLSPSDAYAEAQSAGYDTPGFGTFMEMLFKDVRFSGAGVREHLITVISSCYFWKYDNELSQLENPWVPLMKLYEMGYTSSFDENDQGTIITLLIGYKGAIKKYTLIQ